MEVPVGKLGVLNDCELRNGNLGEVFKSSRRTSFNSNESNCNDDTSITDEIKTFLEKFHSIPKCDSSSSSDDETVGAPKPSSSFCKETKVTDKSVTRTIRKSMTKITMADEAEEIIGNLDIRHFIEQAFLHQNLSADLRWQAVLLAGIPGCGKSKTMKSCAVNIAKLIKKPVSVFVVTAGELQNKYYGQTEKAPKILYDMAKEEAPSIIIVDEIDGLMRARSDGETDQSRRLKTSLLGQMQGVEPHCGVLTICATNRGGDLDSAFVRRFDKIFCLELPNNQQRVQIFRKYTGDDIKKVVALAANRNCKLQVDGNLQKHDDIENFRDSLEKSPNPAEVVPVGLQTDLVQAINEVLVSYKMKDVREMTKFKRDYHLVSVPLIDSQPFEESEQKESKYQDYEDNHQDMGVKYKNNEVKLQYKKTENQDPKNSDTYDDEFCGCLDKICNPC